MTRILITGAAGRIGCVLRKGLSGTYPILRLSDIAPLGAEQNGEELWQCDLREIDQVKALMCGVDAVVHLAGVPEEDIWERIHDHNIVGTYHVFEAARCAKIKRIVFASTNHVIGYYQRTRRVDQNDAPRPDSRYAVSKLFGEALGRLYADKHGLSCICLRIGSFQPEPLDVRMLSTWISHRDMVQLVQRALDATEVRFETVYGVSANDRSWWDNPGARRLGYRPEDNAESYAKLIERGMNPGDELEIEHLFQGGKFCGLEFDGDLDGIDP